MAKQLQLRKGTATEHDTFTGANGEVTVDTTNKTLRVHDGTTAGGTRLATLTGGLVPTAQLPAATTSVQGAVILNNTLTSTSTTQALTAAQGKVLNDQSFGIGQSWVNVSGSRTNGTTYTNSTGKPIVVWVSIRDTNGDGFSVTINGTSIINTTQDLPAGYYYPFIFIVPVGHTYKVSWAGGTNNELIGWSELR